MDKFKELYESDLRRYGTKVHKWQKKFHYYFRKCQTTNNIFLNYYKFRYYNLVKKCGIEIPINLKIGKGLYLGHPYNITINSDTILGNNINIHKGVTIGQQSRGLKKGSPKIGNDVWIGVNAIIVGNINIGDNVLIAPGAYVNCDIPKNSIVVGNPCSIIPNSDATKDYINFKV